MTTSDAREPEETLGPALYELVRELFPICRSITGDGVRKTLAILARFAPIEVREIPSGTQVLDWTIPKEWNIKGAFIDGPDGKRVLDFRDSNLHVVSYSLPVRERLSLTKLRPHLHALLDQPDAIPYRTSYYEETW